MFMPCITAVVIAVVIEVIALTAAAAAAAAAAATHDSEWRWRRLAWRGAACRLSVTHTDTVRLID